MKDTTKQIYNILQSDNFLNLRKNLEESIRNNNLSIQYDEYSASELARELPELIDILKQTMENGTFDILPLDIRAIFFKEIDFLKGLVKNTYTDNDLQNLIPHSQELKKLVRNNRLDYEVKQIPLYNEKIQEYTELSSKLESLLKITDEINTVREKINTQHQDIENILNISNESLTNTKNNENTCNTNNEQIQNLLSTSESNLQRINENTNQSNQQLEAIQGIKSKVEGLSVNIEKFHNKVDSYEEKMNISTKSMKESLEKYNQKTNEIIDKNKEQSQEIDKLLGKAVGNNLFSSFNKRKEELNKTLKRWLIGIVVAVSLLVVISFFIYFDITSNEKINNYYFFLKISMTFPLIYLIGFLTIRYSNERRIIEEYAFKSSIAVSLDAYRDLVKKVEEEKTDSKYRDFLIDSIKTIFSDPNQRVFGNTKNK